MTGKFIVPSKSKTPVRTGTGGLTIGGGTSVGKADGTGSLPSLGAQLRNVQAHAEFKNKPLLVYLGVDLTGSRADTRATMREHEQALAELIMGAGGKHPVVCKGVYHAGGSASAPQTLSNADEILSFLSKTPEAGATDIETVLKSYRDDPTDEVLALGIIIGDAADGDSKSSLVSLAEELKTAKRPVVIAHQEQDYGASREFSRDIAPAMAMAGEGLHFSLGTQPKELLALVENYKGILTASAAELKATASGQSDGIRLAGSAATRDFVARQANTLLLTHEG